MNYLKLVAANFFCWWYNRGGTNTLDGFDEWTQTLEGKANIALAKQERDAFAVGFANWLGSLSPAQKCTVHPPAGSGLAYGIYNKTTDDLLEQYKSTLK